MSLARVAWVGALVYVLLALAGFVTQWLTDWTGFGPWLAVPLGAVIAGLVEVLREVLQRRGEAGGPAERTSPQRGAPAGVAVLITLLLLGGGGLAAAYGIATLSAFITGNQSGTERLAAQAEDAADGITTAVTSVEHTADFTRVRITVRNRLPNTVSLPLYGNATLSDDAVTLEADAFRSTWSETIAPGQRRTGVLVFPGHLADGATSATLAFATVFEQGFEGPSSIVVDGIELRPV